MSAFGRLLRWTSRRRERRSAGPTREAGPYRSRAASAPETVATPLDSLRTVERLSVRMLAFAPIGRVHVGLSRLSYVPFVGEPRSAPIGDGFAGLCLPLGAVVEDRTPNAFGSKRGSDRFRHGTLDVVYRLAKSPGFAGFLDELSHPERFLRHALQRGQTADEDVCYDGFAALGRDRLCVFCSDRSSWAAAIGEELPNLTFQDNRVELLRSALEWLDDEGFDALVLRARALPLFPAYSREQVRQGRDLGDGRLSVGSAGEELELTLTGEERGRLDRWLRASVGVA
jgi:hypothetical protein